jgi:hypothetical protein
VGEWMFGLAKLAAHTIHDKGETKKGAKKVGADEKEIPKDAVYPDELGLKYPDRVLFHGLNVMTSNRGIEGKLDMVAHNKPQICLSTHYLGTIGVAGKTHIYAAFSRDVGSDFDKDGRRYIPKASKEWLIENLKFVHAREVIGTLHTIEYVWVSKKSSAFEDDYKKAKELAKSIKVPVKMVN